MTPLFFNSTFNKNALTEYDFAMNCLKCIMFGCIIYEACYTFSKVDRKHFLYEILLNNDLYDFL